MKLKALTTIQYDTDAIANVGDEFEIADEHGAPLVAGGHAEEVEPAKPAKPETAAEKKAREKAEKEAAAAAADSEEL